MRLTRCCSCYRMRYYKIKIYIYVAARQISNNVHAAGNIIIYQLNDTVLVYFIFIAHFFRGLAGAEPQKYFLNSLFVHSLEFQPTLVQHFPQICSTCHTIFSLKKKLECVCERLLHCRLIFAMTWTPGK